MQVARRRSAGGVGSRNGIARKTAFGVMAVIGFLAVAESGGWIVLSFTRVGPLADANPVAIPDDPGSMLPRGDTSAITVPTDVTRILYRLVEDPDVRGERVWMDDPPEGGAAILLGGSSPYGVGLTNRETFWWLLDHAVDGDVTFLNLANIGDGSSQVRSQIAGFAGIGGRPKLVVIYTGDNEWLGFRYPRVRLSAITRLDSALSVSHAYRALRTGVRAFAQATVFRKIELARRDSALVLSRFPIDTRYRAFDRVTRDFVELSRRRLLERFAGNLESVVAFARSQGAEVILVTTPIRYRLSPAHNIAQVASERFAGTAVERDLVADLRRAVDALLDDDLATAERALDAALVLDPESSLTNHYLGYLWEAKGDPARARAFFAIARDRMIGYGGLLPQLNRTVEEIARRLDVPLVDLKTAFDRHSDLYGDGLGDELIFDWCHPSPAGAELIADELRTAVAEALRAPGSP